MSDVKSINLGSVYETAVAQELRAHGYNLYYYDNKKNGEVDYLIDDSDNLSNVPLEVKSGKDYTVHSALDKFLSIEDTMSETLMCCPMSGRCLSGMLSHTFQCTM